MSETREEVAHMLAQLLNRYGYVVIATPATLSIGEAVKGLTKHGSANMVVQAKATFEEYVRQTDSFGKGVQETIYKARDLNFYKVVMETRNDS